MQITDILQGWLPGGRLWGNEYIVRNPTRHDKKAGSFKINIRTGQWADFTTNDRGGDIISLLAYINHCSQFQAAQKLQDEIGGQL